MQLTTFGHKSISTIGHQNPSFIYCTYQARASGDWSLCFWGAPSAKHVWAGKENNKLLSRVNKYIHIPFSLFEKKFPLLRFIVIVCHFNGKSLAIHSHRQNYIPSFFILLWLPLFPWNAREFQMKSSPHGKRSISLQNIFIQKFPIIWLIASATEAERLSSKQEDVWKMAKVPERANSFIKVYASVNSSINSSIWIFANLSPVELLQRPAYRVYGRLSRLTNQIMYTYAW